MIPYFRGKPFVLTEFEIDLFTAFVSILPTSSPGHLFVIRRKRKRGPGTLQTRE